MFRERITRQYPSLSPSFRKVADLILTSHQRAAFMSASRLAKHVGVDVATVTRFAQQLGYEGYVELVREIQESVLHEMRESRAPVLERLESAESPITQTLWRDWANLEKTIQNISVEDAQRAMEALRSARSIYIIAEGVGIGLAMVAQGYLKMLKPDVFVLGQGPFDTAMELKELTPQDVVIGIGYTSYAYGATQALQFANRIGALTIGIIGQADCPIGTQARLLFACSVTEKGYLPSPTCPGAILFAFIYNLYMGDPDTYNRKLIQFQELYANLTEGTARGDEEVVDDLLGLF
ncbi:MAG: MurR/RpiR family transcriptional regulator [Anaerolineae bacterium]